MITLKNKKKLFSIIWNYLPYYYYTNIQIFENDIAIFSLDILNRIGYCIGKRFNILQLNTWANSINTFTNIFLWKLRKQSWLRLKRKVVSYIWRKFVDMSFYCFAWWKEKSETRKGLKRGKKMHRYWIRLSCSRWQILCDIRLNDLSIGSKIKNVERFVNAYLPA